MTTTSELIAQYKRDLEDRLTSPDWGVAKDAFMESNEWFDGETEIAEAATRRFKERWKENHR